MKQKTRKALALAAVPFVGAFAFGPAFASAEQYEDGRRSVYDQPRHERTVERRNDIHSYSSEKKPLSRHMTGMLHDHGKHKGWINNNPEAAVWSEKVFGAVKEGDFSDFTSATKDTPLGTETKEAIFKKLVLASDSVESGDRAKARDIMSELRDEGYRFKKLFRESLMKMFPRES